MRASLLQGSFDVVLSAAKESLLDARSFRLLGTASRLCRNAHIDRTRGSSSGSRRDARPMTAEDEGRRANPRCRHVGRLRSQKGQFISCVRDHSVPLCECRHGASRECLPFWPMPKCRSSACRAARTCSPGPPSHSPEHDPTARARHGGTSSQTTRAALRRPAARGSPVCSRRFPHDCT